MAGLVSTPPRPVGFISKMDEKFKICKWKSKSNFFEQKTALKFTFFELQKIFKYQFSCTINCLKNE